MKSFTTSLALFLLACSCGHCGAETNVSTAAEAPATPDSPYQEMNAYTETMMLILNRHVENTTFKDLTYAAIDGMVASLDPYSNYLRSDDFSSFKDDNAGHFAGVGVTVSCIENRWMIDYPMPGSPAFKAGIRANDEIVAVDGTTPDQASFDEAMEMIRGEIGEVVVLKIQRDGIEAPFDVPIKRADIQVPTVQSAQILTNAIAYVCIAKFGDHTARDFYKALKLLKASHPKGFILDLRDNPGGLLTEATDIADAFLPKGKIIVSTKGRNPEDDNAVFTAKTPECLNDIPLAVLMNDGSASASEIIAGSIKDNKRGVLIGDKSFGKASVQSVFELGSRPEEALLLTTAHYYTPNGSMIHGNGIEPDIKVEQSPDEFHQATVKRLCTSHPELCPSNQTEQVLSAVDAPLDAAIAYIASNSLARASGTGKEKVE